MSDDAKSAGQPAPQGRLTQLYAMVANEEDARVCQDISESACREVPGNFFLTLVSLVLTKAGDLLTSPKTVLTWLLMMVGAPASLVAWLVPIRESGSLIPQLFIAAVVRSRARRKGFWVLGSLLQGLAVLAMAAAATLLSGAPAGVAIIAALVVFSLSRGLCSVAMKDVQGKTIPKGRRGRLTGLASSFSGLIAVLVSAWMMWLPDDQRASTVIVMLSLAALAWIVAAGFFSRLVEEPGETGGGGNAIDVAWQSLSLLRTDQPFRHFVISRALLMGSALATPFLVVLAQQQGGGLHLLGYFLLASALASSLSATVWGFQADVSSRRVMIRGGAIASSSILLVSALGWLWPQAQWLGWLGPLAAFVLAIGHAGVRVGRKTYLVDMAGGVKRTDYVAVSNTVIGVLLLLFGALSAWLASLSPAVALAALGLSGLLGTLYSVWLDEA